MEPEGLGGVGLRLPRLAAWAALCCHAVPDSSLHAQHAACSRPLLTCRLEQMPGRLLEVHDLFLHLARAARATASGARAAAWATARKRVLEELRALLREPALFAHLPDIGLYSAFYETLHDDVLPVLEGAPVGAPVIFCDLLTATEVRLLRSGQPCRAHAGPCSGTDAASGPAVPLLSHPLAPP